MEFMISAIEAILDNIRDSILHGACEIDEDNKCFIIKINP